MRPLFFMHHANVYAPARALLCAFMNGHLDAMDRLMRPPFCVGFGATDIAAVVSKLLMAGATPLLMAAVMCADLALLDVAASCRRAFGAVYGGDPAVLDRVLAPPFSVDAVDTITMDAVLSCALVHQACIAHRGSVAVLDRLARPPFGVTGAMLRAGGVNGSVRQYILAAVQRPDGAAILDRLAQAPFGLGAADARETPEGLVVD